MGGCGGGEGESETFWSMVLLISGSSTKSSVFAMLSCVYARERARARVCECVRLCVLRAKRSTSVCIYHVCVPRVCVYIMCVRARACVCVRKKKQTRLTRERGGREGGREEGAGTFNLIKPLLVFH